MTIDFYGKEIDKYERMHAKAYTGYFTPNGKLVDYNTSLGGSHSSLANIVSWTFLLWVKNSSAFLDLGIRDVKMSASINMETGEIKNANIPTREYNEKTNLLILQRNLLSFLSTIEKNPEFTHEIRKRIHEDELPDYIREGKGLPLESSEGIYEIEKVFGRKNTRALLMFLKDICIQYLGYDSIEQVKSNGEYLTFPPLFRYYRDDQFTIYERPRKIITPNNNIHKRFFNYMLMDWDIEKAPRYIYNESENKFEVEPANIMIQSDSDEDYEKELVAIKKMVPLKEREKYFM